MQASADANREKEAQVLRTWIRHEDEIFGNRMNWLLVAQAMLYASFAAALATNHASWFQWLISGLGIVITIVWLHIARLQIRQLKRWRERLLGIDPFYKEMFTEYGVPGGKHHVNEFMGIVIPFIFLVSWVLAFVLSLQLA
ncbi:MAG TPA: hypothetical protein VK503_01725 [Candidatus Bathyarchaeia archaeon]|nr:hypothetical protein [Candidatus Bathyarchaeia archaeon]